MATRCSQLTKWIMLAPKSTAFLTLLEVEKQVFQVKNIVEKPGPKDAPSHLASLGGFVFTPDIFEALAKTKLGKGGELWLVDAIFKLLKSARFTLNKLRVFITTPVQNWVFKS